jgi:hypothetical protein
MVVAEPTVPPTEAHTVAAALTLRPAAAGRTVVAALTPPRAAADTATPHRVVVAEVVAVAGEAIRPVVVAATAADTDKLALFVLPKTGAVKGASTQLQRCPCLPLQSGSIRKSLVPV